MAQLVPPPCPHRGCATPRPQNPHPCEEHPWGTTASCSRMKAAKGLLGVAMQSLPGTGTACQRIWEKKAVVWLCSPIPVAAAVRQSSCCFCWGKQNWKHALDILQDVKVWGEKCWVKWKNQGEKEGKKSPKQQQYVFGACKKGSEVRALKPLPSGEAAKSKRSEGARRDHHPSKHLRDRGSLAEPQQPNTPPEQWNPALPQACFGCESLARWHPDPRSSPQPARRGARWHPAPPAARSGWAPEPACPPPPRRAAASSCKGMGRAGHHGAGGATGSCPVPTSWVMGSHPVPTGWVMGSRPMPRAGWWSPKAGLGSGAGQCFPGKGLEGGRQPGDREHCGC